MDLESGALHECATVELTPSASQWATAMADATDGSHAAFVVGVASYPPPMELPVCLNDAVDMAWLLHRKGYAVTRLVDPSRRKLESVFNRFAQRLMSDVTAVLFFSGHGFQADGVNMMVPVDGLAVCNRDPTPAVTLSNCWSLNAMLGALADSSRRISFVCVFLDACRTRTLFRVDSVECGLGSK